MIRGLKPYESMKDSGVAWLGQVPAHWEVRRLKNVATMNPSKSEAKAALLAGERATFLPMERVGADGRLDCRELKNVADVWSGFTYFRRGDVLVAKITPCFENGKGACLEGLPTDIGFGSTEFHVLRAGDALTPQYLYRLTTLPDFRWLGTDAMTGAAGQQRVPERFVAGFLVPVPTKLEQEAISKFLAHFDRQFRRCILAKRHLITLLEEQKRTIIHHAVTRGIQPNAALRASGVDWLGDIPEHWETSRSRRLFSPRKEFARPDDIQLSSTQAYGVIPQSEYEERVGRRVVKISMHLEKRRHVEKDDFVISMRSFQGGLERAWASGAIRSSYVVLQPQPSVDAGYFSYALKSPGYIRALQATANFIRDGQDLTYADFRKVDLPLPPLSEQREIAAFVAQATAELDVKRTRAEREINLLHEYRARLITDVVTGQLDVRVVAAALLDELLPVNGTHLGDTADLDEIDDLGGDEEE